MVCEGYAIIEVLKQGEGLIIGKQAEEGDLLAQKVMSTYKFWYDCVGDHYAKICFENAYVDYKNNIK